jgi:surface carbohydrate biosynthesis protein
MKIFGRKVAFTIPAPVDVVIFDETNAHIVSDLIDSDLKSLIYKNRPEEIWINHRILYHFICCMKFFRFSFIKKFNRGITRGVLKQLHNIYVQSCVLALKPFLVITSIDNCNRFAWISMHSKSTCCISVQNGFRTSYDAQIGSNNQYHSQHLFCYGEREVLTFHELGYEVEHFYPCGSLFASKYIDLELKSQDKEFDILVVSCWRGNIGFQKDVQDSMAAMEKMDRLLKAYIDDKKVKLAVIMRSERDSEHWYMPEIGATEEEYFKSIYGDKVQIFDNDSSVRNVYPLMQQSKLILAGAHTSALLEAYGLGAKILYCNFNDNDIFHSDIDPRLKFSAFEDNDASFFDRITRLLEICPEQYLKQNKDLMNYYMFYPSNQSTRIYICNKIKKLMMT